VSLCDLLPEVRRIDVDRCRRWTRRRRRALRRPSARVHRAPSSRGHAIRAPVAGLVHGIARDGALLVDTPGGRVPVRDGTITPA
jgi:hypothetical protein